MTTPLFSICIPTYNHANDLHAALKTLVSLPTFLDSTDIEIVISDNASQDDTEKVCRKMVLRFPDRIRYFRNDTNVLDANFGLALTRGTGRYRKLANDTLLFNESGLGKMVRAVREAEREPDAPVIFFTNQARSSERVTCADMDAFFTEVSFWSTWIGGFGMWDVDLGRITDLERCSGLQLMQVDVLCRLLAMRQKSVVYNFHFADSAPRAGKGGYDLAQVFGINYFVLLGEYVGKGLLSPETIAQERKRMLRRQLLPFYMTSWHRFCSIGYFTKLWRQYGSIPLYWIAIPFVAAMAAVKTTRRPMEKISGLWSAALRIAPHPLFWIRWKLKNRHNLTAPVNVFDPSIVSVGKASYGGIEVYTYGSTEAKLLIGNYVSIGPHVRFMLSGEHRTDTVSTYPFRAYDKIDPACEDICRGPVIVKDDVWIGMGATILSGVTIGQGAVIGAGAVVTKDVEPYAIVGGVPAKVIRYRFSDVVRKRLVMLDWGSFSAETISRLRTTLERPLAEDHMDEFVRMLGLGD